MRVAVGLDMGGTKIHAGLVDSEGRVHAARKIATPVADGPNGIFEAMRTLICQLLAQAEGHEVVGIGLGIPGLQDRKRGLSINSPNLGWRNIPVLSQFAEFGLPLDMENDVRCHALGEQHFGAGRGVQNFVLLTFGTGIGSGIVLNGELFQGAFGMPGEIGHLRIVEDGPECGCGKRGCLEAMAGGKGIGRRARDAGLAPDARALFHLAAAGEQRALALLEQVCRELGWGVATMANLFNPERIIIGGGIAEVGELLFAPLRRYAEAEAVPGIRGTFQLVPAALHEEAGTVGAAALFPALTGGGATR